MLYAWAYFSLKILWFCNVTCSSLRVVWYVVERGGSFFWCCWPGPSHITSPLLPPRRCFFLWLYFDTYILYHVLTMVTQVTDLTLCDRMCSALIVQVVWLLPQSLPPRADYIFLLLAFLSQRALHYLIPGYLHLFFPISFILFYWLY